MERMLMVPENVAQAVGNYLGKCPWADVNSLVQALAGCKFHKFEKAREGFTPQVPLPGEEGAPKQPGTQE